MPERSQTVILFTHLFDYLYGYERLRHRGDRLFLSGEFESARAEYSRARAVLREGDEPCDYDRGAVARMRRSNRPSSFERYRV